MCSINGCSDISFERKINLLGAVCRKCDQKNAQVVLQGKLPYCRECFLIYFQHKYSGGLGKAKILKQGDKVLVGFSGSFSSVCLLDLIHANLCEEKKKKAKFDVTLIFIDDLDQYKATVQQKHHIFSCIQSLAERYNYKLWFTPLSPSGKDVLFTDDPNQLITGNNELKPVLSSFSSKTSKADFIEILRMQILYKAAREFKCSKIFTGETSDHIATKIIGNIAIGRGKDLSSNTGFTSCDNEGIIVIRPLRECSKKEIAFYNIFKKLHLNEFPWIIEDDAYSSIHKLTETFVAELQQSFPSTISTVVSTGSKLSVSDNQINKCLICLSSLYKGMREVSAEEALRISQDVTILGPTNYDYSNASEKTDEYVNNSNNAGKDLPICYACSILIRESTLPEDVIKLFIKPLSQSNPYQDMYEEIKDFLI